MLSPIRPLPLILFLLLAATSLHAQSHDIRLSGEPLTMILPDDAKIQSAARIGDSTLAVWGTTALAPDSSVYNTLVLQLLDDTTLVGSQRTLTGTNARPFGYVQVLAVGGHYVVLWNDRRTGDTATYLQRVDASGNLMGSEELFRRPGISSFGVAQVPLAIGYQWYWNAGGVPDSLIDSTKAIYMRALDGAGNFKGAAQGPLNGSVQQQLMPTGLPGLSILHRGNLPPLIVDPTGKVDSLRGEAARHFTLPYYLESDGAIETLEGWTLRFYRTLLDSVASKTLEVPIPAGSDGGSQVVTHDTAGNIIVIWASGGSGTVSYSEGASPTVFAMVLTPVDTFAVMKPVGYVLGALVSDHHTYIIMSYLGTHLIHGCDNNYRVELLFHYEYYFDYQNEHTHTGGTIAIPYNLNQSGEVWGQRIWNRLYGLPLASDCNHSNTIATRLRSLNVSKVSIALPEGEVSLAANPALVARNRSQQSPGIVQRGGQLLVGWKTLGVDTLFELGKWDLTFNELPVMFQPVAPSLIQMAPEESIADIQSSDLARGANALVLNVYQQWTTPLIRRQNLAFVPTLNGWQRIKTIQHDLFDRDHFKLKSSSFNPNDHSTAEMFEYLGDFSGRTMAFEVDSNGVERWNIDSLFYVNQNYGDPLIDIVPLTETKFMSVINGVATVYDKNVIDSIITFPLAQDLVGLTPTYIPLVGSYILRWIVDSHFNFHLNFDILNYQGVVLATRSGMDIPLESVGFSVVQSPSDSGFAILYGGKQGSITLLDKHLNILAENIPLSSEGKDIRNPAGVYRNDTLFAVWEDYRNGLPDIYGTALAAKTSLSVRQARQWEPTNRIESIVPNPASDAVMIRVTGTAGARIEVIDSYGRTRLSLPGADQTTIDTRGLPAGAYRVVLRGDRIYDSRGLAVTH